MAKHFRYFDDWRSAALECPSCGWRGTFEQGLVEYHDELADSSCPACDASPMLAIVSHPTIQEAEANWEKLSDREKLNIQARKKVLAERQQVSLKSIDQLPELNAVAATLTWDCLEGVAGRPITVIRHGDIEIWREPAYWEGYQRFSEVVEILKRKYGERLVDVVPTEASMLYLLGDKMSANEQVERVRNALRNSNGRG